jgi:hypothetical protein
MANPVEDWLDRLGRRHPGLMLAATILLGVATTIVLIYNSKDTAIVYKAF